MIDDVIKFFQFLTILGIFLHMHCIGVSLFVLKIPRVRLSDQARGSILTCQSFISLKLVTHILFAVKGVFPKGLESMLSQTAFKHI